VTQAEQRALHHQAQSERNLDTALLAMEKLLAHLGKPDLAEIPDLQETFEKVIDDAIVFYDRFTSAHGTSPQLQHRAARVFGLLARLAHGSFESSKAAETHAKAIALADRLVEQDPSRIEYRELQASVYLSSGSFYRQRRYLFSDGTERALRDLQHAKSLYQSLSLSEPGNKEYPAQEADALLQLQSAPTV
jgi:hypothetical protein